MISFIVVIHTSTCSSSHFNLRYCTEFGNVLYCTVLYCSVLYCSTWYSAELWLVNLVSAIRRPWTYCTVIVQHTHHQTWKSRLYCVVRRKHCHVSTRRSYELLYCTVRCIWNCPRYPYRRDLGDCKAICNNTLNHFFPRIQCCHVKGYSVGVLITKISRSTFP